MAPSSNFSDLCVSKLSLQMFRKTTGIVLSLIGAIAWGMPSVNALDIGVSPPRFEVEINNKKNRSQSINIVNLSTEAVEMRAYVRSWTIDQNNEMQLVASSEQSLDQWIVFTPSRFRIPGRSSQTLRFAIRPRVQPTSGEHRAVLYIEEVPRNNAKSLGVTTVGRFGVIIYGYAGEVKRVGTLNSINVQTTPDKVKAVFDISSTGNAHVRIKGQYAIWRAANYPGAKATRPILNISGSSLKLPANVITAGELALNPVLAKTRRQLILSIPKKLPPGNYVLDLNGELSGVAIDKGIPFTVPAAATNPRPVTTSTR
jgi:P pilus assembly chaperone PapD